MNVWGHFLTLHQGFADGSVEFAKLFHAFCVEPIKLFHTYMFPVESSGTKKPVIRTFNIRPKTKSGNLCEPCSSESHGKTSIPGGPKDFYKRALNRLNEQCLISINGGDSPPQVLIEHSLAMVSSLRDHQSHLILNYS